ncbi:ABC transporter ATP-binding protein [Candidatus Roizmanbacteria bacterium CG_4_10_14_0_8_um_filter_39_9]|uniref:ABC transporter ATP-binding protein n=1 Tax=Candidatus Roizmanbacteria bacterium CG_4_10_14_0_8_um_filter_39_9 TaxID=1974829 RepID=A0A2M7QDL7_9BACT|nr:MAG: ABC transporter ATP-binding protein [Candidatus Roizmanbacteria bacterium CG_4_10_14_0_8_um_filter_39_9]
MAMDILKVDKLIKRFGEFMAVDTVSFSIREGETVGLLGPNGAGKTTTIQMLLGITTPTSGIITYFGRDFEKHRPEILQKINFASAFNSLQGRVTVWENLLVFAHLYQIENPLPVIKKLVSRFEMDDLVHKRYWDMSTGQRTRANFIKALLNDPKIILMDEPTASLDPDIADKTLTFIEELRKERAITILFTSHNMSEVARICDRVIFLDKGKIVAQDTPLGLTKRIQVAQLRLTFNDNKDAITAYVKEQGLNFRFDGEHVVYITTEETALPKIIFGLSKIGIWMTDIEVKKPTLEHVFLQIARGEPYVFE